MSSPQPHPRTPVLDAAHPVILFDGVCTLCNGAVRFVIERDPADAFRFASLQSEFAQPLLAQAGLPPGYLDGLVLVEDGRTYAKSDAVLRIARRLDRPWQAAWALRFVPRPLRDAVYDVVARHRYRVFGKEDSCPLPTPAMRARLLEG